MKLTKEFVITLNASYDKNSRGRLDNCSQIGKLLIILFLELIDGDHLFIEIGEKSHFQDFNIILSMSPEYLKESPIHPLYNIYMHGE